MGFFDRFKGKDPQFLSSRMFEVKYAFECSECGTSQVFCSDLNFVEDEHYAYVLLLNNCTGKFEPVRLPSVLIRFNEQEEYIVESIHDRVEGGLIELSRERMIELMLTVQCQNCGTEFPYIIATAVITNEQGHIKLMQRPDLPHVHTLPLVILGYNPEENSFGLRSILHESS